ncbi:MAG: hypothetical protein RH916_11600 [Vicingaceae bacterium]
MELKAAYIGLTAVVLMYLILIGFKAINETSNEPVKQKLILILALISWQLIIYFISSTGILKSYDFPPRIALAFILPSFLFTGVFLSLNRNSHWINSIPEHWTIYFQSFRIVVETLFVFTVSQGLLNRQVTIEGYNFDMIVAITAPILAYLVYHKKVLSRSTVLLWNYVGLLVLSSVIFLFLTSIYWPEIYGSEVPLMPLEAFSYPYVLIAGFLMPTAVFLHIFSILQLTPKDRSTPSL